jgi:cofilin
MVQAGTSVAAEISAAFSEINARKARFLVARITEDSSQIVLEAKGERTATFDDFVNAIPADQPRYGVFDLEFTSDDGRTINKMCFVTYVPDTCKSIAVKFPYANCKDTMKSKCSPVAKEIQVNDRADLTFAEFRSNF